MSRPAASVLAIPQSNALNATASSERAERGGCTSPSREGMRASATWAATIAAPSPRVAARSSPGRPGAHSRAASQSAAPSAVTRSAPSALGSTCATSEPSERRVKRQIQASQSGAPASSA
jgi:hypothetical protein